MFVVETYEMSTTTEATHCIPVLLCCIGHDDIQCLGMWNIKCLDCEMSTSAMPQLFFASINKK